MSQTFQEGNMNVRNGCPPAFVDSARFTGTCYRAAGWQVLGSTQGYSKCNKRYRYNGQPKLLLVRPLLADAPGICAPRF